MAVQPRDLEVFFLPSGLEIHFSDFSILPLR